MTKQVKSRNAVFINFNKLSIKQMKERAIEKVDKVLYDFEKPFVFWQQETELNSETTNTQIKMLPNKDFQAEKK